MAYQKLQAGKAWSVYPSDNTNIPDIGVGGASGTTTSGSATQLIDASRTGDDPDNMVTLSFLLAGIKPGMIIVNTTDGTQTTVKSVVNGTTLNVSNNIFTNTAKAYAIYGDEVRRHLAKVGAEPIFGGEVNRLILGEVEELWDVVAVVRYPSRKAMFNMATSDEYRESEKHRTAGLAGQLNIEVIEDEWNFE